MRKLYDEELYNKEAILENNYIIKKLNNKEIIW